MKRKTSSSQPVTKGELAEILKSYPTKKDLQEEIRASEVRTGIKLDQMEQRIDDKAQQYRDQVLTKMDGVMKELDTIREEQVLTNHHIARVLAKIENHEGRISKLEETTQPQ